MLGGAVGAARKLLRGPFPLGRAVWPGVGLVLRVQLGHLRTAGLSKHQVA